jgi:hypothetical protein
MTSAATVAALVIAGASYLGATIGSQSARPGPAHHALTPRFVVRLPLGQDVQALAASGPYVYIGADHGGTAPYTLSAYLRATGRLIRTVRVPAVPTSLVAGPAGSLWLTFVPNEGGGPCGTWLLTADLARRSAARLLCNYAVLPTGPRSALTVVGTNGHLGTVLMPPPGEPGRPHVTRTAYLGRYAVASLIAVGGHVAALLTNDFGDAHLVIVGQSHVSYGGVAKGPFVQSVAAQAGTLWVATYPSNGPSYGPLVQLSGKLRPITPRRVASNPVLRKSEQVWSHQATTWVATASNGHRLVCFADHGVIGPLATIPSPSQPAALAVAGQTVYIAVGGSLGAPATEVLGYQVPAVCS